MARLRDFRLPKLQQRPTPLHDAACFGNVAKALEALKDDPNIDVNDASLGANTPLQGLNSIHFKSSQKNFTHPNSKWRHIQGDQSPRFLYSVDISFGSSPGLLRQ